jgi:hypothetical protein
MARGNRIVVRSEPNPRNWGEGIVKASQTFYPGQIVQRDPSVALQGGAHTFKIYSRGADGDPPTGGAYIVIENYLLGKTMNDSYAAGERFFWYKLENGDEINGLLLNIAGTADDHALDEKLMLDDTTGKFIASDSTKQKEVAQLLEALTDPTADTLLWMVWNGN